MTPARRKMLMAVALVVALFVVGAVWPASALPIAIALLAVWLVVVLVGRSFFRGRAAMAARR